MVNKPQGKERRPAGALRGASIGSLRQTDDEAKGVKVSRERVQYIMAQEIGMELYRDELMAKAGEEMEGLGPNDLAQVLLASTRFPNSTLVEIARAVHRTKKAREDRAAQEDA